MTSRDIKHDVACVKPVDANCSSHLALPCCCACGGTHMLCALPMQDAVKAVQDKPLEKIQGVISKAMVELPDSVPAPLGALYTNSHCLHRQMFILRYALQDQTQKWCSWTITLHTTLVVRAPVIAGSRRQLFLLWAGS